MSLGEGVLITEIAVPSWFAGKSLAELALPTRFGVTVVALRRGSSGAIEMPRRDTVFEQADVMVVVAKERGVTEMVENP